MKKTFLLIVTCFMLLTLSSVAFAAEGPYVGGNLGFGFLHSSGLDGSGELYYDNGFALGLVMGYNLGQMRVEGEFGYTKSEINRLKYQGFGSRSLDNGDETSTSFLLNGYYDLLTISGFTPYVSAGVGFARLEINDFNNVFGSPVGNDNDSVFAYQVGFGVGYELSKEVTIDLKYRYFATEDPSFGGVKSDYNNQQILVGVRYNF